MWRHLCFTQCRQTQHKWNDKDFRAIFNRLFTEVLYDCFDEVEKRLNKIEVEYDVLNNNNIQKYLSMDSSRTCVACLCLFFLFVSLAAISGLRGCWKVSGKGDLVYTVWLKVSLVGSWLIKSTTICNQTLLVPYYMNISWKPPVYVIIRSVFFIFIFAKSDPIKRWI